MRFLLASFAASVLLTAFLIRLAWRFQWSVPPRPDRWNQRTVAKFGGVPILLTLLGSALCLPLDRKFAGIVGLTALAGGLGFLADLFHLSPPREIAVRTRLRARWGAKSVRLPLTREPHLE